MKVNKLDQKKVHVGTSDFIEGKTVIDSNQQELLENIAKTLTGVIDKYDSLKNVYASKGLIAVLKGQVKAKFESNQINSLERKEAVKLIDILENDLKRNN